MLIKQFKVTLLSDVVINASLTADQTNLATLEYIPGSNFLGIVANACYDSLSREKVQALFHSDRVSFGDAYVLVEGEISYPIPFCLYLKKGEKIYEGQAQAYVFHQNPDFFSSNPTLQFEQQRKGFFTPTGKYVDALPKRFSLKSAQDRSKRRSKDEAMFGMEALSRGLEFGFSVYADDADLLDLVEQHLGGIRHVGKSKSAQYGLVRIEPLEGNEQLDEGRESEQIEGRLVVYAISDLCLFDECGVPTQIPTAAHFGVKGRVDFLRSQLRPHSYSTRNTKRNAINMRRDCIKRGSVIVIDLDEPVQRSDLPTMVGGYIAEGLGWVCYNPPFLQGKEGEEAPIWRLSLKKVDPIPSMASDIKEVTTSLGRLLKQQHAQIEEEQKIIEAVQAFRENHANKFRSISTSQWGVIRKFALKAADMDELINDLFGKGGILSEDSARHKEWSPTFAMDLAGLLKRELEQKKEFFANTDYVVVLASEMAKFKQDHKSNNE